MGRFDINQAQQAAASAQQNFCYVSSLVWLIPAVTVMAPADQLPVSAAPTAFQNWFWLLRLSRVGPLCLDNRHAPSWKRFCQSKRALATIIRTLNFPFDAWEWYATDINWTHKRSYLCLGLWWKARVFQIAFEFFISYICHLSLSGLCLAPFARSLLQSYNRFFEDIHECHSSIAIQCIDVYDTVCGLWIVGAARCNQRLRSLQMMFLVKIPSV